MVRSSPFQATAHTRRLDPSGVPRRTLTRLTPEQEADLIARGLPERVVRSRRLQSNGALDYASLTSGSFSDRIRNGYA